MWIMRWVVVEEGIFFFEVVILDGLVDIFVGK